MKNSYENEGKNVMIIVIICVTAKSGNRPKLVMAGQNWFRPAKTGSRLKSLKRSGNICIWRKCIIFRHQASHWGTSLSTAGLSTAII